MLEYYVPQKDFGTPPVTSTGTVSLTINGFPVAVPAGTSVMRAAALAGIKVPRLCATDTVAAFGSCRLCLVEIDGAKGFPASCTTPVAEAMVVRTESPAIAKLRRNVMELYISDHPLDCLTCPVNGDCELQDAAGEVGLRDVRYGYAGANILMKRRTTPTPTSASILPNVSSVHVVFAPVKRSRGRLR